MCTSTDYISNRNGIRRVDAVDKSACRANRDHTTRKPIRVAAARAVRANVRLDAIEIPRETSSFPLFLSLSLCLANYNKIQDPFVDLLFNRREKIKDESLLTNGSLERRVRTMENIDVPRRGYIISRRKLLNVGKNRDLGVEVGSDVESTQLHR